MVDDLEERLTRYRADLDAAVAADLARRHREAGFNDADPLLLDTDRWIRLEPAMPTMSASVDRRRVMSVVATLGVAAAVTLVLIVLVASRDGDVAPANQPSPTVTVLPTTPPRALREMITDVPLLPGTYFVDEVDGTPTARIFATIGAGWTNRRPDVGWYIDKRDIGFMAISRVDKVFSDACHPNNVFHPGPVTTVDGLVAALSEQAGWADVTAPSDISVDGYAGKAFQRTAPAVMSDCSTAYFGHRTEGVGLHPDFRSWEIDGTPDLSTSGYYYERGEIETLWVLDIDGTVVVINTGLWPGPSAAAHAGFADSVLDSIRIDRG